MNITQTSDDALAIVVQDDLLIKLHTEEGNYTLGRMGHPDDLKAYSNLRTRTPAGVLRLASTLAQLYPIKGRDPGLVLGLLSIVGEKFS